jgi:hypothetical protein
MAKKNVDFYINKIALYFDEMDHTNLTRIEPLITRHGTIRTQISTMDGIISILTSITDYIKRDKRNQYPLLKRFINQVDRMRRYVSEYNPDMVEGTHRSLENEVQFTMMGKINKYEEFIEKELAYKSKKAETEQIDIQGNTDLSLADRKLI